MRCSAVVLVVGMVLAVAGPALAVSYGNAYIRFNSVNPSSNIEIWAGSYHYSHPGGAGVYNYLLNTGSPLTTWDELIGYENETITFHGFCSELGQYTNGWDTYNVVSADQAPYPGAYVAGGPGPMGLTKYAALRELWGRFGPAVDDWDSWTDWSSWPGSQNTAQGQAYAEAFQIALWEIVFEDPANNYDVAGGYLHVNPATVNLSGGVAEINNWLSQINGDGPLAELRAFVNPNYQDVMTCLPKLPPSPPPVPEPVTGLGVMLGISSLAGYFRRQRK